MNREERAEQRRKTAEEIEAGKIKILEALKANFCRIVATLSDAEWEKLKREEDQRRRESKP